MRKIFLMFILVSSVLSSCSKLPSKIDHGGWYLGMIDILTSYNWVYLEMPENINDMIHFLELKDGLLSEGMFEIQYDFIRRNRNRIIVDSDFKLTSLYFKKKREKNLIIYVPYDSYCGREKGLQGYRKFYDETGDPILGESYDALNEDLKMKLRSISYKTPPRIWQKKEGAIFNDIIIVEYTEKNGLINICSQTKIDLGSSPYYQDLNSLIKDFCQKNNLSRIVLDTYLPVE